MSLFSITSLGCLLVHRVSVSRDSFPLPLPLPLQDELAWAVAVGTISFLITLIMTIMLMCKKNIDKAHPIVSLMMVVIWNAGVGVCTFDAPFKYACGTGALTWTSASGSANGYFATWIAFVASCRYYRILIIGHVANDDPHHRYLATAIPEVSKMAHVHSHELIFLLLLASFTVMAQTITEAPDSGNWTDMQIWAMVCSVVSAFLGILMMLDAVRDYNKYISAVLAVLWMAAVATLTFTYANTSGNYNWGMYASMGNGFFGVWVCFFVSFVLAFSSWVVGHKEGEPYSWPTPLIYMLLPPGS